MSNGQPNFGDTLTSGIQDVAALLPLLGTEQCEQHVGSALERGYLYAAATPLSIFGSLGIVKASFTTFLATINDRFNGAKWLEHAGFGSPGSVSCLANLVENDEGRKEYNAEAKLVKLLEDQHIDNVEKVEWSGWKWRAYAAEPNPAMLRALAPLLAPVLLPVLESAVQHWKMRRVWKILTKLHRWLHTLPWNVSLILATIIFSSLSFMPYIYLIHSDSTPFVSWGFPFLRGAGSALCVITMQLALRRRIDRIVQCRLLFMTLDAAKYQDTFPTVKPHWASPQHSAEERLRYLNEHNWAPPTANDVEQLNELANISRLFKTISSADWILRLFQAFMVIGMGMTVVGYVGCFNLVNHTSAPNGPYVWVGPEIVLSIMRTSLWGSNPKWDDIGMQMKLRLAPKDHPPQLTTAQSERSEQPFVVHSERNFLGTTTLYTGPFQRFKSDTTAFYYCLVGQYNLLDREGLVGHYGNEIKYLYTAMLDLHTHTTSVIRLPLVSISTYPPPECIVYSSSWELSSYTGAIQVVLGNEIGIDHQLRRDILFQKVVLHSRKLASRLSGCHRIPCLHLRWTLEIGQMDDEGESVSSLSQNEKSYLKHHQLYEDNHQLLQDQEFKHSSDPDLWKFAGAVEILIAAHSFVCEIILCQKDLDLAKSRFNQTQALKFCTEEYICGLNWRTDSAKRNFEERWRNIRPKESDEKTFKSWSFYKNTISALWNHVAERLRELRSRMDLQFIQGVTDHISGMAKPEAANHASLQLLLGQLGFQAIVDTEILQTCISPNKMKDMAQQLKKIIDCTGSTADTRMESSREFYQSLSGLERAGEKQTAT